MIAARRRGRVSRKKSGEWALQERAFKIGYEAALEDIERDGLHPKTSETRGYCAARAWARLERIAFAFWEPE